MGTTKTRRKARKHTKPGPAPFQAPPRGFVPVGRRSSYTKELGQEIANKIAAGDSIKDSALTSGIAESTIFKWLAAGRAGDPAFVDFSESVTQAEATARRLFTGLIRRAAVGTPTKPGDWKAAQALGAMRAPDVFVPQINIHVTRQLDSAIERLKLAFGDDAAGFEKALRALAGSPEQEAEEES